MGQAWLTASEAPARNEPVSSRLERRSALNAPAQVLKLAPHGTRSQRVAEDDADEERGGDVDDVFEGHGRARSRETARSSREGGSLTRLR